MLLVFLGPPGAGKGTQAQRAAKEFSLAHISTGDMLRKEVREGTDLGNQAKKIMEAGELVSDEIILGMVKNRLQEPDCANGALFDGFPRTLAQAEALCGFAKIDMAVNIDVPAVRIVERLGARRFCPECKATMNVKDCKDGKCPNCGNPVVQRDDDRETTVRNRLDVYEAQTKPLIEFFEKRGVLKTIDGDRGIDAVYGDISASLRSLK
jgi:adenylate kinase